MKWRRGVRGFNPDSLLLGDYSDMPARCQFWNEKPGLFWSESPPRLTMPFFAPGTDESEVQKLPVFSPDFPNY